MKRRGMSRRAAPTAFLGGCGQQARGFEFEVKKSEIKRRNV